MGRTGTGVEVRASSIRIKFSVGGVTHRERLTLNGKSLPPTPANIKYAHRVAAEVRRRIEAGAFTFAEYFPDSPHAQDDARPETFGHLADVWLRSQGRLAEATKGQYATAVRFWKRMLGDRLVKDVTHKLLAAKIGAYPWPSAKTHNNYLIALRGILALEYRAGTSPATGIENIRVVKKLPDPLTTDERDTILVDLQQHYDERVYAYFLWQFYTGMRPEETIALRWSYIDWKRKTARVQRVRTYRGGERDGSKTHSERDVDLLPQAMDALRLMKPHTYMLKTARDDGSADVFQNPVTGRPWHDERSQRDHYWKPSLKRLGIRWRRAYNTRHTFASAALMAGVPPAYIASQLGHSVKMLLDKYARWIPGADSGSARDMMERAMGLTSKRSKESE